MHATTGGHDVPRLTLLAVFLMVAAVGAHHGSADYDVGREVTVEGTVTQWRWSSPHTWVSLTVTRPDGSTQQWSGEGPPLQWAEARGWSKATLKPGETVRLVMYPSRREAHGGLIKRIERASGDLLVSRPWLDGRQ
jgi:hypothetical protein